MEHRPELSIGSVCKIIVTAEESIPETANTEFMYLSILNLLMFMLIDQ